MNKILTVILVLLIAAASYAQTQTQSSTKFSMEQKSNPIVKSALLGQFILAEGDLKDYMKKTKSTPPIVFIMMKDFNYFKEEGEGPNAPLKLHLIDDEDLEFWNRLSDQGITPALGWGPLLVFWDIEPEEVHNYPNIPRILSGEFDEYIKATAQRIKDFKRPIMMTLLPEFNNYGTTSFGESGIEIEEWGDLEDLTGQYGDPEWPDGPERVRDVIIHVIDIFDQVGANNVSWFMYANSGHMTPHVEDADTHYWSHPKYYYPGDEYIDWVGKSIHFTTFDEFVDKFDSAYDAWGEVTSRPFFIPEFSFHENLKDRSELMRQIMLEFLPTKERFKAATFYHSQLDVKEGFGWGVPLGGRRGQFRDEIIMWRKILNSNPYYHAEN